MGKKIRQKTEKRSVDDIIARKMDRISQIFGRQKTTKEKMGNSNFKTLV